MKKFLVSITLCAIIVIALTASHLKFWATTFLLCAIIWNIYYIRKTGAVKNFYRYLRHLIPAWFTRVLFFVATILLFGLCYSLWKYDGIVLHSATVIIALCIYLLAFIGEKFHKRFKATPPDLRPYLFKTRV